MNGIVLPWRWILVVAVAPVLSGCAAGHPLSAWRQRVHDYVQREGNGDPAALRELLDTRSRRSLRPSRIRFTAINVPGPEASLFRSRWDAEGVLTDIVAVDGCDWYLFMVGLIQRQPSTSAGLKDIRVVAMTPEGRTIRWRVSPKNGSATARYVDARGPTVRSHGAVFPGPLDQFGCELVEGVATVTERGCGAAWVLPLRTDPGPVPADAVAIGSDDGELARPRRAR